MPEQPPPFTPRRTPDSGLLWARFESCALICCAAFGVTLTRSSAIDSFFLGFFRGGSSGGLLLLPVGDGGLDGVLGQNRAVDLDRRQRQLLGDLAVGDLDRVVHRLALPPLGDERAGRDGRAA